MNKEIGILKKRVVTASADPNFIHHKWFVKYHLDIVYDIAIELTELYPESNKDLVEVIVWLHDYGKILSSDTQDEALFDASRKLLTEISFDDAFIEQVMSYLEIFEGKMELDLNESPLEVKIVSSADAASHFFGPFFYLWWYENPSKNFEELMKGNEWKARKDWDRKIVLPEVKKLIENRFKYVLEQSGDLPTRYITR